MTAYLRIPAAIFAVGAAVCAAPIGLDLIHDPYGLQRPAHSYSVRPAPRPSPPAAANDPVQQLCAEIDAKLSSVELDECNDSKLRPSGALSNRKKSIAYRDFEPPSGEPLGRVLLVGGIHGDEYSSVTAVFKWLRLLASGHGGDFHWRVVPLLNPDGLLMPPEQSQRMNANGVDLNRNFPTPNWETEAMDYWVNRTRRSKRRYPGPAPLSEPESRWLASQIEEYRPHAVISVHAPHGIVDFDGPRIPPENLGPLELRLLGTYPGSMGRYIGVYKGIPLLTLELESATRLPEDEDMDRIWIDMVDWLSAKIPTDVEGDDPTLADEAADDDEDGPTISLRGAPAGTLRD